MSAQNSAQARDVVEGRPGIIETSHIDPLDDPVSQRAPGWSHTATPDPNKATSQNQAGVIEGRPGIVESSHIEPLDDSISQRAASTNKGGVLSSASEIATGAARMVQGLATGDASARQSGKEKIFGK
jgi:hypothetical protein